MNRMKQAVALLLVVVMMVSVLSGCGKKTATKNKGSKSKYKVCMVTDAGDITDQSFRIPWWTGSAWSYEIWLWLCTGNQCSSRRDGNYR
ncbi:hypothetical protein GPL24_08595 [Anaerostipes hadrus]|uniref:hypothetical protein n=1 Tax=Anaerostipes TaxID=207244 RepID=UPI001C00BD35|nr:hypothetical protein [Anaerostipes hadrus]MBT9903019.1 hypothetical protein [Anaerostipes hadrus]